ncbi:MAG: phosphoadenosine phosphosulfate reductase family protein [Candidatus Jordarchaeaceae archaeon]
MYGYTWDRETGGYVLQPTVSSPQLEVRPVFFEELDLLGFDRFWEYPQSKEPLLWAQGRQYFYRGELVAETIGGRLFVFPRVEIYKKPLELKPVDVEGMIEKNQDLMDGLVKETLEKIYTIFKKYRKKSYFSYVAFSGGKDSLALLDLVQRALSPDDFVVIFADTTMEFSETYRAFNEARRRWPAVKFYVARSERDARETWKIFGPPSRTLRWCRSVHKSVPSLLLLRRLVGEFST